MPDELVKITLNLYKSDVEEFRKLFGYGWSERIRLLVRDYVLKRKGSYQP